jgi:hypothetical protein
MPKSKKPRKAYKPKPKGASGVEKLLMNTWMNDGAVMDLQLYAETAFAAIKNPKAKSGSEERMNSLVFMLNVSMILAEKIAPEVTPQILECRDALAECFYASQKRAVGLPEGKRDSAFGLSGQAIKLMPDWLLINQELLSNCKYGEAKAAIQEVWNRISQGEIV